MTATPQQVAAAMTAHGWPATVESGGIVDLARKGMTYGAAVTPAGWYMNGFDADGQGVMSEKVTDETHDAEQIAAAIITTIHQFEGDRP